MSSGTPLNRIAVFGSVLDIRHAVANEISDQHQLPKVLFEEEFGLIEQGDEGVWSEPLLQPEEKSWVAVSHITASRRFADSRRRLLHMADCVVMLPRVPDHFLGKDVGMNIRSIPRASSAYDQIFRITTQFTREIHEEGHTPIRLHPESKEWLGMIVNLRALAGKKPF